MTTLTNRRKIYRGRIWDAYFEAVKNGKIYEAHYDKGVPFTGNYYDAFTKAFDFNGKTYAVLGFDHFNGHFSGFSDESSIFGIYIAEIK